MIDTEDPTDAVATDAFNKLVESYNSEVGGDKFVADLVKTGVNEAQAKKIQATLKSKFDAVRKPGTLINDPDVRQVGVNLSRQAAWYALSGVAISMIAVILGSLIGSGDIPVPVPVLGVRRSAADPRL